MCFNKICLFTTYLGHLARDRDERLRLIKDQQNLERQKKLDELKAQAFAAQKYREQKEEERKRRIEEMRLRENDKRQQVSCRPLMHCIYFLVSHVLIFLCHLFTGRRQKESNRGCGTRPT